MTMIFGDDPVRAEVAEILRDLDAGTPRDTWESKHVDLKEEAGRRDRTGRVVAIDTKSEAVAEQLLHEAACMANTPGGGALIVGVSNTGELVGALTDAEWLRMRLYQKSNRRLTVDVSQVVIERDGHRVRLLVIFAPEALEPIRVGNRINWRVADNCVEVDANAWHAHRIQRLGFDWSAQPTTVPIIRARARALEIARDYLLQSGEESAHDLAASSDGQLLARLNVATPDGYLTNAGVLTFVGREHPCLDYLRRDIAGGDTLSRVNRSRALLEELDEVLAVMSAHVETRQVMTGPQIVQVRELPLRAAREAVVNGVAHRDWSVNSPTVVEHIGRTLRVTSPGGFVGGVTSENILTHPSVSRNPALTQLFADLRIAEREGIGVDRMVVDMVRVGHVPPTIIEIGGPYVRTTLLGDPIDTAWMQWLASLQPAHAGRDVNMLLILRELVSQGWVDPERAAVLLQTTIDEVLAVFNTMRHVTIAGEPVLLPINGVPDGASQPLTLNAAAISTLRSLDDAAGNRRAWPSRRAIATSYARSRGRISSTELASLTHSRASNVGSVLKNLEADGVLAPSTQVRAGRGFYYLWAQ